MQIADRGAAQFDGADAAALAGLGGEEGDHVGAAGRQAGQAVPVAPGLPGAHPGAVGMFRPAISRFGGRPGGVWRLGWKAGDPGSLPCCLSA
jgi:hypothetical protein